LGAEGVDNSEGDEGMDWFLVLLIGLLAGHSIGWIRAHHTIAHECEKIGQFYVGDKVFVCQRKSK